MREITIKLPHHIAHRLEVSAAKDDMRLVEGIETLLIYLANRFEERWTPEIKPEITPTTTPEA